MYGIRTRARIAKAEAQQQRASRLADVLAVPRFTRFLDSDCIAALRQTNKIVKEAMDLNIRSLRVKRWDNWPARHTCAAWNIQVLDLRAVPLVALPTFIESLPAEPFTNVRFVLVRDMDHRCEAVWGGSSLRSAETFFVDTPLPRISTKVVSLKPNKNNREDAAAAAPPMLALLEAGNTGIACAAEAATAAMSSWADEHPGKILAARALWTRGEEHHGQILAARPVPLLVAALTTGTDSVKHHAAATLGKLLADKTDPGLADAIMTAGAARPLVALLASGSKEAATTVCKLLTYAHSATSVHPAEQDEQAVHNGLLAAGVVAPLIRLLVSDCSDAALALVLLSFRHRAVVVETNACPALLSLLHNRAASAMTTSACCRLLSWMASENEACKAEIMAGGAAPALVELLKHNHAPTSVIQTIDELVRGSRERVDEFLSAGAAELLVAYTRHDTGIVKAVACEALCHMAAESPVALVRAGAIDAMRQLLSPPVKVNKALVVSTLAHLKLGISIISITCQMPSDIALQPDRLQTLESALLSVLYDDDVSDSVLLSALRTFWPSDSNLVPLIIASGAAHRVVSLMLSHAHFEVKQQALFVFGYLANHSSDDDKRALLAMGAAPALVAMAKHDDYASALRALDAMRTLTAGDEWRASQLLNAGVTHALASLLRAYVDVVKVQAAWLVHDLVCDSIANAEALLTAAGVVPQLDRLAAMNDDFVREAAVAAKHKLAVCT